MQALVIHRLVIHRLEKTTKQGTSNTQGYTLPNDPLVNHDFQLLQFFQ